MGEDNGDGSFSSSIIFYLQLFWIMELGDSRIKAFSCHLFWDHGFEGNGHFVFTFGHQSWQFLRENNCWAKIEGTLERRTQLFHQPTAAQLFIRN